MGLQLSTYGSWKSNLNIRMLEIRLQKASLDPPPPHGKFGNARKKRWRHLGDKALCSWLVPQHLWLLIYQNKDVCFSKLFPCSDSLPACIREQSCLPCLFSYLLRNFSRSVWVAEKPNLSIFAFPTCTITVYLTERKKQSCHLSPPLLATRFFRSQEMEEFRPLIPSPSTQKRFLFFSPSCF